MHRWCEVNVDRVVGPTHHYGGLGVGNVASETHRGRVSYPQAAALQGLAKARECARLGVRQVILPPQHRPVLGLLKRLGIETTDLPTAFMQANELPGVLSAIWSSSAMWTANAATVSPGCATADTRTHFTVANLSSSLHRSLETEDTVALFRKVFSSQDFVVHQALPCGNAFRDEGAANHMRLSDPTGTKGVDIFVYGEFDPESKRSLRRFPRQSLLACQAIAKCHGLDPRSTFYLQQHPAAIDAGAFHNDVVATSHQHLWLHHEMAYLDAGPTLCAIAERFETLTQQPLIRVEVTEANVPLADAVSSYLFNSQLLAADGETEFVLMCPQQVREVASAEREVTRWVARHDPSSDSLPIPLREVRYVELRESMNNGGGPACLRLRVPMTVEAWSSLPSGVRWTESLHADLCSIVESLYPKTLCLQDLMNPELAAISARAVNAIEDVLGF